MGLHVFFSYSRFDLPFARALVNGIERRGIECWIDVRDSTYGNEWDGEIERAIHSAKAVVVLVSPHSSKSNEVLKEIDTAERATRTIIPVLVQDGEISHTLSRRQWIDSRVFIQPAIEMIVDIVVTNTLPRRGQWFSRRKAPRRPWAYLLVPSPPSVRALLLLAISAASAKFVIFACCIEDVAIGNVPFNGTTGVILLFLFGLLPFSGLSSFLMARRSVLRLSAIAFIRLEAFTVLISGCIAYLLLPHMSTFGISSDNKSFYIYIASDVLFLTMLFSPGTRRWLPEFDY